MIGAAVIVGIFVACALAVWCQILHDNLADTRRRLEILERGQIIMTEKPDPYGWPSLED